MGIKCSAKQGARNPAHFPLKKRNRDRPSLRIHHRPEARRPRDGLQLTRLIDEMDERCATDKIVRVHADRPAGAHY